MADNVKISDLTELTSGSLRDATIFPVVDGGSTQKTTLASLQAYLTDDLATDAELATQVSNLNTTIDGLNTTVIDEGSNLYYTNARVNTVIDGLTIISGAAQIESLGFISSGTNIGSLNQFTASYYEDSASFAERILAVSASGGDTIPDGTISGSTQISDLGYIQTSTINSPFIAERLPINIVSSSEQLEQLIAINGGSGVTVTSGSGEQISIEITADGGGSGGGVEYDSEYEIISQSNITDESNARLDGMILRSGDETTFANFSASVAAGGGGGGGTDYISSVSNTVEAHTISFTGIGSAFTGDVNLPDGIISSSNQIEDLGFSGGGENIVVSGLQAYTASLKTTPIISGSQQITDFGFVSESSTTIPQGTISGSQQITDLGFISESAGITSSAGVILAEANTAGFDTSYVQENVAYLYYTDARVETHLATIGLLSGSQGLASGSVTSSAQIVYGEIRNIPKFWPGEGITIQSGSEGDTANYIQINSIGGEGGTLSSEFYSFTASYELEKANFITGSSQIEALGFDPNAGDVTALNAWTSSGGDFGIFSQSVINAIENLETGSLTDDFNTLLEKDLFSSSLQISYAIIPDVPSFTAGPGITIDISGSTFGETFFISSSAASPDWTDITNIPTDLQTISQSGLDTTISSLGYATTTYADGVGTTTSQSLESAFIGLRSDITTVEGDITTLEGDYVSKTADSFVSGTLSAEDLSAVTSITINSSGSFKSTNGLPTDIINMTGSLKITGSIEADEFIVGSTGTPSITSATDIEVSASIDINMTAQEVNINDVLTITPRTTTPTSPSSGSFIVSGSGATIKPFFWDGNEWQELSFV
jgi:hypothetical protein